MIWLLILSLFNTAMCEQYHEYRNYLESPRGIKKTDELTDESPVGVMK